MVVFLIFERMLRMSFFPCVFIFKWSLLFKMFIVGIYLVINGMPMILCFMSVNEMFAEMVYLVFYFVPLF